MHTNAHEKYILLIKKINARISFAKRCKFKKN